MAAVGALRSPFATPMQMAMGAARRACPAPRAGVAPGPKHRRRAVLPPPLAAPPSLGAEHLPPPPAARVGPPVVVAWRGVALCSDEYAWLRPQGPGDAEVLQYLSDENK